MRGTEYERVSLSRIEEARGYCECGCGRQTKLAAKTASDRGHVKGEPHRFLAGHSSGRPRSSVAEYIESHTKPSPNGCRLWVGSLTHKGYGQAGLKGWSRVAHRLVYEAEIGPIPEGLHLDHLCLVKACVNPAHLEPVTNEENMRRRAVLITHCPHGHEYTPENTLFRPKYNDRLCRTCRRAAERRRRAR